MIPDLTKTVTVLSSCTTTSSTSNPETPNRSDVTYEHVDDSHVTRRVSGWLPGNADASTIVWTKVDRKGALLMLPEFGE